MQTKTKTKYKQREQMYELMKMYAWISQARFDRGGLVLSPTLARLWLCWGEWGVLSSEPGTYSPGLLLAQSFLKHMEGAQSLQGVDCLVAHSVIVRSR